MKYIRISIIIPFLIALLFAACENYLDLAPELDISEKDVFENYLTAQGHLDNCYNALNDISDRQAQGDLIHFAAMSDEGASTYPQGAIPNVINPGQWLGKASAAEVGYNNKGLGTIAGNVISNSFYSIRIANRILKEVPKMTSISENEKNELLGQAYFMRAWYYFEIIRRWGGMPLLDKLFVAEDELDTPRLTYQESTDWLISDLDKAYELLPQQWDGANTGRVTKIAALALKGMAALYAASPLMQNDLITLTQKDYNSDWAKKASRYAHEALVYIDNNQPEKRMKGEGMSPEEQKQNYQHIFYHYPNFVSDESLWYKNSVGADREVDMAIHFQNVRFSNRAGNWGFSVITPSQNLVDMFEMADGTPFDWNNPIHATAPYTNRDPRFYNNILYPGRPHGNDKQGKPMYLETWDGGSDLNTDSRKTIPTGYMCIKWWWPEANGYNKPGYKLYYYNGNFIRTAQVWLDYAEAMNEAYGPNEDPEGFGYTAVQSINKVRSRVGMPPVKSEFTSSKEEFRKRIRNERAVELMFENHRWFDIRRWMIAKEVFSDPYPIKGIKIEKLSGTNPENWVFNYSLKDVVTEIRVFNDRHYWYPIAYDHIQQLGKIQQNPGW